MNSLRGARDMQNRRRPLSQSCSVLSADVSRTCTGDSALSFPPIPIVALGSDQRTSVRAADLPLVFRVALLGALKVASRRLRTDCIVLRRGSKAWRASCLEEHFQKGIMHTCPQLIRCVFRGRRISLIGRRSPALAKKREAVACSPGVDPGE